MRVIIADSDRQSAATLRDTLQIQHWDAYVTDEGADALSVAKRYDFDALVLSDQLIDKSCVNVVRAVRMRKLTIPTFVLANDDDPKVRAQYLDVGADDCMSKPYCVNELSARLRAIVRRASGYEGPYIKVGDLTIDLSAGLALARGVELPLAPLEYRMLELLSLRKGKVVSRARVYSYLYDEDTPEYRAFDVFVCRLRKKLAAVFGGVQYIQTVHSYGYALRAP